MKKVTVYHMEDGVWVSDGVMSESGAESHIRRCEYNAHGIKHRTVPVSKKKVTKNATKETGVSETK